MIKLVNKRHALFLPSLSTHRCASVIGRSAKPYTVDSALPLNVEFDKGQLPMSSWALRLLEWSETGPLHQAPTSPLRMIHTVTVCFFATHWANMASSSEVLVAQHDVFRHEGHENDFPKGE